MECESPVSVDYGPLESTLVLESDLDLDVRLDRDLEVGCRIGPRGKRKQEESHTESPSQHQSLWHS